MPFDFDDCYWHDSLLRNIYIDRSNPGVMDTIEMVIDWYDKPATKIIFRDVRLLKATMHFGMVVNECILSVEIAPPDDPDLTAFYEKFKTLPEHIQLYCYIIETNSTGGLIKIIAESVEEVGL